MTIESLPPCFAQNIEPNETFRKDRLFQPLRARSAQIPPSEPVDHQLALRLIGAEPVAIDKTDIQSREIHEFSLMPAGLLSTLKDDEAIARIAYLRTTKQVPPKE